MKSVAKGQMFERISQRFLEKIFVEIGLKVVRSRLNPAGTQDGFDVLLEVVDDHYRHYHIYSECKNYASTLHYTKAIEKIPHIISTREKIDLLLFISPFRDFGNPNEDTKLEGFYKQLSSACPVEFLTPESRVSEYLGLYPELYKEVYLQEAPELTTERRTALLEMFEKLIFSNKNLKKIIVGEERRVEFIGKLQRNPFHMERTFRREHLDDIYAWDDPDRKLKLAGVLEEGFGIVVLGNPGYGKTQELGQLAVALWENREVGKVLPKYCMLKDFNSTTNIAEMLPVDYVNYGKLVVIFDGIDEVHQINDFTNKLRAFMSEYSSLLEAGSLKFVVSCRTSVYLKYVKDIEGLQPLYLNGVHEVLAVRFLLDKFRLDVLCQQDFDFWRFRDVFQNPYYLELIGRGYKQGRDVILSRARLMEQYVEQRLEQDFRGKYRNDASFTTHTMRSESRKIALAMEVTQRAELSTGELMAVLEGSELFAKNPFVEQNPSGTWSFEHKNVQEFLAAELLAALSFEEIVELIAIDANVPKVHPGWHNVVAFLLNMEINPLVHKELLDWLVEHDLDVVFGADPEHIVTSVRINSLQLLFQRICVEQSLWLDDRSTIARFTDLPENIAFLLEKAKDVDLNLRARISALNLLGRMSVGRLGDQLQEIFLQLIEEFKNDKTKIMLMGEALHLCLAKGVDKREEMLALAIERLREDDQREIARPLLKAVGPELMGMHLDFVLELLRKSIGELPWNHRSQTNSLTSTKERIFEQFCQVVDPDVLCLIFAFVVERHKNYQLKDEHVKKFLDYVGKVFSGLDQERRKVLSRLICGAVLADKIRYFEVRVFADMVMEMDTEAFVVDHILAASTPNREAAFFLSMNASKGLLLKLRTAYEKGMVDADFILRFRNDLRYHDMELAVVFEVEMEQATDYRFDQRTDVEEQRQKIAFDEQKDQREFDVRFKPAELLRQIELIYAHLGKGELSSKDLEGFSHIYYDDELLQRQVGGYAKMLFSQILYKKYRDEDALKIGDLVKELRSFELERWEDILEGLPNDERTSVSVSNGQQEMIHQWCLKKQDKVIGYLDMPLEKLSYSAWLMIRLWYGFQTYFRFVDMKWELLFKLIWQESSHEGMQLGYMDGVIPKEEINGYLFDLLKDEGLDLESRYLLLEYFHKEGRFLDLVTMGIKDLIRNELDVKENYFSRQTIELLYPRDTDFMEELVVKYGMEVKHHYFIVKLLEMLITLEKKDFVSGYLVKGFDQFLSIGMFSISQLLSMLMRCSNVRAISEYRKLVQDPQNFLQIYDKYNSHWKEFGSVEGIPELFGVITDYLATADRRTTFPEQSLPIRLAAEALQQIGSVNGAEICLDIIERLDALDLSLKDGGDEAFFYANRLRQDLWRITNVHRSKAYDLGHAIDMLQRYKYRFLALC